LQATIQSFLESIPNGLKANVRWKWWLPSPDQPGKVVALFQQIPALAHARVPRTLLSAIFD